MRNLHDKSNGLTTLARYFLRDGLLDAETLHAANQNAIKQKIPLPCYLVNTNILSSKIIFDYCAKQFKFPTFNLEKYNPEWLDAFTTKLDLFYHYRVIPLNREGNNLYLGVTDPTNHQTIDIINFHTGLHIRPKLVAVDLLEILLKRFSTDILNSQLKTTLAKLEPNEIVMAENKELDDEPVIAFVNQLISEAISKKISDIHIEPHAQCSRVRFRRDGLLYEATNIPSHLAIRVETRLKIMANLDIAERRLPQDGRLHLTDTLFNTAKTDVRINTCPTLYGEKIVLRILDKNINIKMDALGLTNSQLALLQNKLMQPQGLILVTGPTGSGKTITLYSALHFLNQIEKNISSVEDPVEVELNGINQVNINPKIGLDFATVLRSFLRQDPDVLMVGEIRDIPTATIALQAAQTGHLVLSTLHTNSAAETLIRLQSMGINTHHLINSISLIVAQRLVRKLCDHCKQESKLEIKNECLIKHFIAVGCKHCYQGYSGRTGIFELIPITNKMTDLLLSHANVKQLLEAVRAEQGSLLWEMGIDKIKAGITSYNELVRVLNHP